MKKFECKQELSKKTLENLSNSNLWEIVNSTSYTERTQRDAMEVYMKRNN